MSQGFPSMHTQAHAAENAFLLLCCRSMLTDADACGETTAAGAHERLDWDYLFRRAQQHGIGPFVYHFLKTFRDDAVLPLAVLEKLKKNCMTTLIVNRKLLDVYEDICAAFESEQICLIPYKGISFLSGLYGAIDLRPMSDIDILVKKNDVPNAAAVLERMGFHSIPHNILFRDRHFHLTFIRHIKQCPLVVEIHWHVDFSGSPFALRIEDVWNRAQQAGPRQNVYAMDIHDNLLLNLYHLLRDPDQDKVVPLKNCVDIALLLQRHRAAIDWCILRQRAADYSLQRVADFGLALLEHLSLVASDMLRGGSRGADVPRELIEAFVCEKIFPDMEQKAFLPEGLLVHTPSGVAVGLNPRAVFKTIFYHLVNEYIHQGSFAAYLRKIMTDFRRAVKNYVVVTRALLFNPRLFSAVKEIEIKRIDSLHKIESWLQGKG